MGKWWKKLLLSSTWATISAVFATLGGQLEKPWSVISYIIAAGASLAAIFANKPREKKKD